MGKFKIETKEELKYVMDFYGIKQVPIREGGKNLGVVTANMEYKGGNWKYTYEDTAFKKAITKINEDIDLIKKHTELSKKVWETHLIYRDNGKDRIETNWFYKGDFQESGVTTYIKDELLVVKGTIDMMRYLKERTNHHYIYCNGTSIHFDNKELIATMEFFDNYGFYAPYDSFEEYIRMTPIVD